MTSLHLDDRSLRAYTVALNPDLPHLVNGPNAIIGRAGRLWALFVPRSEETRDPRYLSLRVAMSRLGLPEVATILAVSPRVAGALGDIVARDFDLVIGLDETVDLAGMLENVIPRGLVREETRRQNARRFSQLTVFQKRRRLVVRESRDPFETVSDLQARGGRLLLSDFGTNWQYRRVAVRENVVVSALRVGNQRNAPTGPFRRQLAEAFSADYSLDNGVPYAAHLRANILLVDSIPVNRLDPSKPLRSAAFAGVTILRSGDSEDIERTSDWLDRMIATGTDEHSS